MIEQGDGTWERWLRFGRCPKCQTMLPDMQGGSVSCKSCNLSIRVEPCRYSDSLGECRDGMIREPDGEGCVQWTTCFKCQGKGWT